MNKNILSSNLLILKQSENIFKLLAEHNIPVIMLKGIAMINLFEDYISERQMEDIDLLCRKSDFGKIRDLMKDLEYFPAPEDPWAFYNPQKQAYVDFTNNIWYMNFKEQEILWQKSKIFKISDNAFHMPPEDFYIHLLAHAAVHHGHMEEKHVKDLKLIGEKWGITKINEVKLKKYGLKEIYEIYRGNKTNKLYNFITQKNIPLKGHVLRFSFLPLTKKFNYLFNSFFPSKIFIKYRYNLSHPLQILLFQLLRPFVLILNLFRFTIRFILN